MKTFTVKVRENSEATLTALLPDSSLDYSRTGPFPAVLVVPGGGYYMCSDREAEPVAFGYMAEGFATFILRYTVKSDSFENPFEDIQCAMETIIKNAVEWNLDPDNIAAIGFSAGGHLTAALGTMGRVRPKAIILAYPCILPFENGVLAHSTPALDVKVSEKTPPTFIFATFEDGLVPVKNTLAFINALNEAAVPFESHIFQKGGHGLSIAKDLVLNEHNAHEFADFAKWMPMSVRWLNEL